jgi:HrpA-like RNA helicase
MATYQRRDEGEYRERKSTEEALKDLDYPVVQEKEKIMEAAREHPNFVLVGETGSGKTTCLPIMLLEVKAELGLEGKIAVTQPRRVAARSVGKRVSDLMGCEVGQEVGYQVRFEDHTSEGTEINFMTDGILLRKMQFDPLLEEYSIVMVDEAHERSLNIDLCLGLLKDANDKRAEAGMEPIRIAVTSATIEREKFAKYFGNGESGNSIEVPGKMFPVQVSYESQNPRDFMQAGAEKVKQILDGSDPGDILVFMPGKEEIDRTIEGIEKLIDPTSVEIIRLHADMSPEDQDRIFHPNGRRKIIVSTNIAETSVTIPSVRHVVDSGYIKQVEFDAESGIEQLVLRPHAISGLEQRKGRAGRVAPGNCYRLFSENSLRERHQYQTPEIQRSELAHVVLTMKKIGIADVEGFDFIDPPDRASVRQAIETLKTLGAIDEHGNLTETGGLMAELGLEPKLGRMVIEAQKHGCVEDICTIAAFFGGKRLFNRPKENEREADAAHAQFKDGNSDFITCLNVWDAYAQNGYRDQWARENFLNGRGLDEARKVRYELLRVLRRNRIFANVKGNGDVHEHDKEAIGKAVTAGLIGELMEYDRRYSFRKMDGTESGIYIHPSSTIFRNTDSESLMVSSEVFKNPQGKIYASNCQLVKPEWIPEVAPHLVKPESSYGVRYDPETDGVVKDITLKLKGSQNNTVVGKRHEAVEGVEAVKVFAAALARGEVPLPEALIATLEKNKQEVSRLNDLWRRAEGNIEE